MARGTGRGIGDRELERALVEVGSALAWADHGELATVVRTRIEARGAARPVVERSRRPVVIPIRRPDRAPLVSWRAAVAAVAAVAVLATGILAISPSARHAVADWLGLGGERITVTPTPPPVPSRSPLPATTTLGQGLDLGRPTTTLSGARRRIGFRPLLPDDPAVGPPAAVYVRVVIADIPQVFLVWPPGSALPESDSTGVGLLLSEFKANVDRTLVEKFAAAGQVERLRIDGSPAYWIHGLHEVSYVARDGRFIPDTVRLAGNVLLWSRGGITLRLESALSRAEAVRLARSVR